ncbi:hypothetical protein MYX07_03530, partial [Patescibacteria group bacterium AH-259-L07]|nr:hypothetical protein [Patescibacteria group bacterium AH-259-L07]
ICQNCKQQFMIEPEDFDFYEKMDVPPPTFCPECRLQRRLSFLNERFLYKRNCDCCNKEIVTYYSSDKPITVYCPSCWWSDQWDGMGYGRECDFSRPFLEQLRELFYSAPHMALSVDYPSLVNSRYVNYAGHLKNCYLIYVADYCDNVHYSNILAHDKDSMDCTMLGESELCYGNINCGKCYKVFFSEDSTSCHNVYFSKYCVGCSHCFGCINLRNKSYYIFNRPYSKSEYERRLKEFKLNSYTSIENLKKKVLTFWHRNLHKFMHGQHNVNVTGDYVYHSKNLRKGYQVRYVEDGKFCQFITLQSTKDAYDYTEYGNNAQRIYECVSVGEGVDTIRFSYQCWPNCSDIEYSMFAISCSGLFGCVGLKKKQYCILNKQYTKQEYETLVPKIIQHMKDMPYIDKKGRVYKYGEFFPVELSPFTYNETLAQEYFSLDKKEVYKQKYVWEEPEKGHYTITLKSEALPDRIEDAPDTIVDEILECSACKGAVRIIKPELKLLRHFRLPLPRKCPNCRHQDRFSRLNPVRFWHRTCQCAGKQSENRVYKNTVEHFHKSKHCPNEFETTYSPDRKEIVYCEKCYQQEVV